MVGTTQMAHETSAVDSEKPSSTGYRFIDMVVLANVLAWKGVEHISSPSGSVGRDLNLQKLNYQYLTTSVAAVLVVR